MAAARAAALALWCLGPGAEALRALRSEARQQPSYIPVSSYVSDDGLQCVQGAPRDVEGVLALRKSSPYGKLYTTSRGRALTSCADRGFPLLAGKEPCYVSAEVFHANASSREAFQKAEQEALATYQAAFGLAAPVAKLLGACPCHPDSEMRRGVAEDCPSVGEVVGSNLNSDAGVEPFRVGSGLVFLCEEGPFEHMVRQMATIRSSPLGPTHREGEQLEARSCRDRGFTIQATGKKPDHCYPPANLWVNRTEKEILDLCTAYEKWLMEGVFKKYALKHEMQVDVLDNNPACNCLPGTEVFGTCKGKGPRHLSPIRDWWVGQEYPDYLKAAWKAKDH